VREVRLARLSVWQTLKSFFEDEAYWNPAYNVYNSRQMDDPLVQPYIFLMESRRFPGPEHLPIIFIDTYLRREAFELGAAPWWRCEVELNIFGRTPEERDDLAGAIALHVDKVSLYNFNVSGHPLIGTYPLEPVAGRYYWVLSQPDIPADVALDGSMANWIVAASAFIFPPV